MLDRSTRWPLVIFGCGYTGERVATSFLRRGHPVLATTRSPDRLGQLAAAGARIIHFDAGAVPVDVDWVPGRARILYSIPPLEPPERDQMAEIVGSLSGRAQRAVYLSTTGVYGNLLDVNETTPAAGTDTHAQRRLRAETTILSAPWSALVLRPAAIYGPGRGVHMRIAAGTFSLVDGGENYVSRIHVEDLASITEAALDSDLPGTWPVADHRPCTSREIAEYSASLLGAKVPASVRPDQVHHTRRANRRVDGSAVLQALGLALRYPTYREGIPASLLQARQSD
jgi:nucleoside-diphosphate-sugar epimerase